MESRTSPSPPASPPSKRPRSELEKDVNGSKERSVEEVKYSLSHARSKIALLVHKRQLGNPVLKHIRHVRMEYTTDITADFLCGPTSCCLFLSLQYHLLHPRYIYTRVRNIGRQFRLRILLVLADVAEHRGPMHELTKLGLVSGFTVIVAGCEREAARYLETLRSYDSKGAEGIQERVGGDYASRVNAALSSVRGVNRTDVASLVFTFGKFKTLGVVGKEDLRKVPGVGERKVERLFAALHQPFRTDLPWEEEGKAEEGAEEEDGNTGGEETAERG